jgi:hypothetical protein
MQINVKSNLAAIEKKISAAAFKQIPFAAAQTLTALGRLVAQAEKVNEASVLDRPKPFTQDAVGVIGATSKSQQATVFLKDITARYLAPYEFGGPNALNSKAVLTPIAATTDLDQFGNLPRNWMAKLRGRKDIFIGTIRTKNGPVNGVWQRSVEDGAAVSVTKLTKKGVLRTTKTRRGTNTSGKMKLLVKFTDAHAVKQHLGWFDVADRVVKRHFDSVMGKNLARALASAK